MIASKFDAKNFCTNAINISPLLVSHAQSDIPPPTARGSPVIFVPRASLPSVDMGMGRSLPSAAPAPLLSGGGRLSLMSTAAAAATATVTAAFGSSAAAFCEISSVWRVPADGWASAAA
jgi:hypothetical protein